MNTCVQLFNMINVRHYDRDFFSRFCQNGQIIKKQTNSQPTRQTNKTES